MKRAVGLALLGAGVAVLLFVVYRNSRYTQVNRPFSAYSILNSSWYNYKDKFLNPDGRVIDYSLGDVTTSEGQSYALLRAVWIDDKEAFDLVWKWTKETLKRPDDNLFSWRWGKRSDGSYGVLEAGGENSASDATSDIALALIFAGRRWGQPNYIDEAKIILKDHFEKETDNVNGKRYLIAGNWAKDSDKIVVNPSYFSPYAWRIFAEVDPERDWLSLIDPAYELLAESSIHPLDKAQAVGLPPDWLAIKRNDGLIEPIVIDHLSSDYAFDAMRIPWRIGLDASWFNEPRATNYLHAAFDFLKKEYMTKNFLASGYTHDGLVTNGNETPAMYATSLPYFMSTDKALADKIYQEKILYLYSNDNESFNLDLTYYDQNWLWFGVAYYQQLLDNI